jgi:hypothetical protein
LTRHAEHGFDPESSPGAIGRSLAAVPVHLIPKFLERLNDFVDEFTNTETDDGVPVTFTYVFLPGTSDPAQLEKRNES